MAVSVTICNLALGDLRAPAIQDIGEDSNEAKLCARYYPHCLSLILDDHPWSFVAKTAVLAELSTNARSFEWAHAYTLPNDCARALRILPTTNETIDQPNNGLLHYHSNPLGLPKWDDFIVEAGVLYTQVGTASLEYAANTLDEGDMPPLFREALRKLLAANLAVPIRDSADAEIKLLKEAEAARQKAIAADRNRAPVFEQVDDVARIRAGY